MIEHLLKYRLPNEYGLNPESVHVYIHIERAPFTLSDEKACERCHQMPERADRAGCNTEMLKIDTNNKAVTIVEYERYIEQFANTEADIRERCDYLLVDDTETHRKIAFCDLTCMKECWVEPNTGTAYPEGKRAKARQQMKTSIENMLDESLMAEYILTFHEKVCVFGWREYDVPAAPISPQRGNVLQNMQAFATTPSNMARSMMSHQNIVGHGFTFMQVKYPNVYVW